TSGCWPIPTTPWWAPSTRTGPSRAWRATASCWARRHGGSPGGGRGPAGASTRGGGRRRGPSGAGGGPGGTVGVPAGVGRAGSGVAERLAAGEPSRAVGWLMTECALGEAAAETIAAYLGAGLAQLGLLPTMDTIVLERFFDDAGGMQLIGHAPFGARLNRALG